MTDAAALSLRGVRKRFGETAALVDATCVVRRGTVHALLGENGAGKSTLMRIAFGLLAPDDGVLERNGRVVRFRSSREAIASGVGMVHQHFMLVPALTVAENAVLGGRGSFDRRAAAARTERTAANAGLAVRADARVYELPVGAQQRAELVRALSHDVDVLILDEPTAVLTPSETDDLLAWMRRFAANGGSVVLITHKLREALAVADDITVLRRGTTVLTAPASAVTEEALVAAVVGADVPRTRTALPAAAPNAEPMFALDAASVTDARGVPRLRRASVQVRRGEVLGVLGVEGAGAAELLRLLAGRLTPSEGRVQHPAVVGFIPADRLTEAVIPAMTLAENLALADAGRRSGVLDWSAYHQRAQALVVAHDVRARGAEAAMRELSGGNQQKFVVARETALAPEALVAENPTRGLDVRASDRVLAAIRDVAIRGGAAVVHSTDMDEILSLTRRVVVCFDGRVTEIAPPADPHDTAPYARALLGAES